MHYTFTQKDSSAYKILLIFFYNQLTSQSCHKKIILVHKREDYILLTDNQV